ncbi:GYDIA family GHMP kinase [Flavobacterium sp.]|jgi:mevalonate kinase|uniref:GYDIA family GHMP kinase n=1 Tax=Flavobacterium sp. TaxID=239 RepID=UPI0025DA4596|nr:GYDIA family GHMP kinase [Flavobacterium sp.]
MQQTFYSNGKLLITGEYLVLDGAKGLALPTKMGQNLIVKDANTGAIHWKSYDADGSVWFEDTLSFEEIQNNNITPESVKATLIKILQVANAMNPDVFSNSGGLSITTQLSFPRNWGLGTSSTLINNIAQWFQIDAFELLHKSFGGSGYDIACAQNNNPITYSIANGKPKVEQVVFEPEFSQNLYFVYLNQKRNSKSAIAEYHSNKTSQLSSYIATINELTQDTIAAATLEEFAQLLHQHETMLSALLKTETVKDTLFPDFDGTLKSLGAWGGDFVLAVSKENPKPYFVAKGYETVIPYSEMIL